MAGVSQSAGGPAWAAGVYPGGGWEPGVLSTMQAVGAYIGAIGPALKNTYASTAYSRLRARPSLASRGE